MVEFHIGKRGSRPCVEEIDQSKAEGLKELVDLMEKCWDGNYKNRPEIKGLCFLW